MWEIYVLQMMQQSWPKTTSLPRCKRDTTAVNFPVVTWRLTFMLSGTRILRAFLIIGCGLSSSSLKVCLMGSKFCWPEELDRLSEGSMSNIPTTSGPLPVGVSRGGQEDDEEEQGDSQESFILVWLPESKQGKKVWFLLKSAYPEI